MKGFIHSDFWQALLLSILLTALFLNNYLLNIAKPLDLSHNDVMFISAVMKHYVDIIISGNFKDSLTLPFFYGFANSVFLSEHYLIFGIASLPFYFITHDMIFTFNFLAFISLAFNFFSMFILTKYVTRNILASIFAGIIFAYNPFVISHFPDINIYYTLGWIPLIFLYLEKIFAKPSSSSTFLFFFFLTMQAMTTMTYVAYLSIILPVYTLIRWWQTRFEFKRAINYASASGLILFAAVTLGFIFLYNNFYAKETIGRTIVETSFYSAWISDYLFSPSTSLVYGGLRHFMLQIFPNLVFDASEIAEHNLFPGLIPIFLLVLSFLLVLKSKYKRIWIACLIGVFISMLLSFGPFIHFTYDTYIPGPYYALYIVDPLIRFLRVASRFAVFFYLFLALISAFTLVEILKYFSKKAGIVLCLIISLLLLAEYWNKPFNFVPIPIETRQFYNFVAQQKDIHVIVEFPMGNLSGGVSQARNQYVDTNYIFWQTNLHSKKLLNGYSGVFPLEYQKRQQLLSVNFPTPAKLKLLKQWGVEGIILHKDQFQALSQFEEIRSRLKNLGIAEIKYDGNLGLYKLPIAQ